MGLKKPFTCTGNGRIKFTVTYDYNGGTGSTASAYSAPGYPAALPGAAREGYLFKGWFEDEGLKMPAGQEGEEYTAYADITLLCGMGGGSRNAGGKAGSNRYL